MFLDNYSLK